LQRGAFLLKQPAATKPAARAVAAAAAATEPVVAYTRRPSSASARLGQLSNELSVSDSTLRTRWSILVQPHSLLGRDHRTGACATARASAGRLASRALQGNLTYKTTMSYGGQEGGYATTTVVGYFSFSNNSSNSSYVV